MSEVLDCFDSIVRNVSNSARLQEECDILVLRISKHQRGGTQVMLGDYKACMLASLRSLLPGCWSTAHEVAWAWLWENVERMLTLNMNNPARYEAALTRLMTSLDDNQLFELRKNTYVNFFAAAPAGQDYFKQSNSRLHFIAERVAEMTLELYRNPVKMVDDISALGLRHVGYAIPTELFGPFVTASIKVLGEVCNEELPMEAYRWSLGLISKILVRTITEGSTIVMKAINANSPKMLQKAISCASRGERASWMLVVQVGTQHISPLYWAIETGSLEAATAVIKDLLTIRADRERYYYGMEELFTRHPDVLKMLCNRAPTLLPVLLDGLIWRSRDTKNGMRRVNYYVKHLLVTNDGGVSPALRWLTASKDPKIISHPVITLVSDRLWRGLVSRLFTLSKISFILSLIIFMVSQAILPNVIKEDTGPDHVIRINWAIVCGRLFTYVFSMPRLAFKILKTVFIDVRHKKFVKVWRCSIPESLHDKVMLTRLLLVTMMICMCVTEPMTRCLQSEKSEWPTQDCKEAEDFILIYKLFSMVAMTIHWLLVVDMSVYSTKLSAFSIVISSVFEEIGRFIAALTFLLMLFGSAISVLKSQQEEWRDFPSAVISLFSLTIVTYQPDYRAFFDDPLLVIAVFIFAVLSAILLLNLLIAQLNCSYEFIYQDALGFALLKRASLVVDTLTTCPEIRWVRFAKGLRLDVKLEFDEGDVGLPGGIQAKEPASLNTVLTDAILRFGGSCSPSMQWPEDTSKSNDDEDKFERIERILQRTLKRVTAKGHHRNRMGRSGADAGTAAQTTSSSGGSSVGGTSEASFDG
eukprot:gnl/TRDRNA2_/TRDRNA2_174280_c19_seq5.p1 gnl/TRDRNA2_/TRDRNA2_174280_c19~~gnl/TRDRNA2_/TRDRNA2_174280_c19_seq5.p1  ORF type:complete len:946 (-),score=186.37 gnl/TRDRNA2_/TRDRNA2_174280_c19_seq5:45-2477(-)